MSTSRFTRNQTVLGLVLLVVISFALGFLLRGTGRTPPSGTQGGLVELLGKQEATWTCSMHPQVQLPAPGACPICGMDLIPIENIADDDSPSDRRLVMSAQAKKLAEIRTVAVQRKEATAEIRLVGKIEYDQTLLSHVTAWVPGRLDRMFVDYEGVEIRKGDHMVDIYSPELLTAQAELLEAIRAAESLRKSELASMRQTAESTVTAARERLRLWGLTSKQISDIERRGEPTDKVTLFAPTSGIVVGKEVTEGMYVDTGTRLYSVADLSWVWVVLDAYESDMPWIRFGQEVVFTVEAYPGETFRGRISFIDQVLNARTRTVKVRVNVENPHLRLKPEMFVRATVHARLAAGGKAMAPEMAGQWICPMHPEVVDDQAGSCRKCGMALVSAESLGYAASGQAQLDLLVPASAVLRTGKRAIVYVAVPNTEQPTFEGREIVLGPRAGDDYVVHGGLREGERVVVNGNFKIDSALQIQARPSMMSPTSQAPEVPAHFLEGLSAVYQSYLLLQDALTNDDLDEARSAFALLHDAAKAVPSNDLSSAAQLHWTENAAALATAAKRGQLATTLEAARSAFHTTSTRTLSILSDYGHSETTSLFQFHCPMAFDNAGADWLQAKNSLRNPYFGSSMLRCGNLEAEIAPQHTPHHDHGSDNSDKGGE